jgi:hypothetical protein
MVIRVAWPGKAVRCALAANTPDRLWKRDKLRYTIRSVRTVLSNA